jgi:hypothetical protein
LSQADEYLSARGVTSSDAKAAGLFEVADASQIYSDFRAAPALVIPYFDIAGEPVAFERDGAQHPFARIRYLSPAPPQGKRALRYTQPADSGSRAYFPPGADWAAIAPDPGEPVIITEGEIKALKTTKDVAPCIGLGGVYNFTRGGGFLPELASWRWDGREVYVIFDSDAAENPNVLAAESRLVHELQITRGARCRLVRLPATAGGEKQGLDDFLVANGAKALLDLVLNAQDLYALDAKVISLNQHIAWIERESKVYDLGAKMFLPKDSLLSGGKYSTLTHILPAKKAGAEPKRLQVARAWLTHPHAQRFGDVLFRPGEGPTVSAMDGSPALNLFTGWDSRPGDVQPFLDLYRHITSRMPAEHRDLLLRLWAYKMQNPMEKPALCAVLIGPPGCGKSLLLQMVKDAFGEYGVVCKAESFVSQFQGWLERSLFVVINEAERQHMVAGDDVLKSLISDIDQPMNEKFRVATQVKAYAMYGITSNKVEVGAFAGNDRRMIVVGCPEKLADEFYTDYAVPFQKAAGGRAVAHYLLNLDLAGWRPPVTAPLTAEKAMAHRESLTPVQQVAQECRQADENRIKQFLDSAIAWGSANEMSSHGPTAQQARATLDAVAHMQVRPWYTPAELALIFPMLLDQGSGTRFDRSTPAGQISRELRNEGIPFLECLDNPEGFRWQGRLQQFLVIADFAEWAMPITQSDFDRQMAQWPRYGQLRGKAR